MNLNAIENLEGVDFVKAWAELIGVPYSCLHPADLFSSGNAALMLRRFEASKGSADYRRSMDMQRTFYLLRRWANSQKQKPVFLVTCDIGSCFEVWTAFDGHYGSYGARECIKWVEPAWHSLYFHTIFTNAQSLNPAKKKASVTKEVAEAFSEVAAYLEQQGHNPEEVTLFLTRFAITAMLGQFGWLPDAKSN